MKTYIYNKNTKKIKDSTKDYTELMWEQYNIDYQHYLTNFFEECSVSPKVECIDKNSGIYQCYALDETPIEEVIKRAEEYEVL